MVVEINTDYLINSGLTANEFLLAFLVYERDYNTIETLKLNYPKTIEDNYKTLIEKDYVKKTGNRIGYTISQNFLDYVLELDSFDSLLAKFPVYVIRDNGSKDYLRTDKDRCRRKYNRISRTKKSNHDFVMKCLDYELKMRERENSLKYMKRLPNWLDSKEWEAWAERMEHEPLENSESIKAYGTDLE